MRPSPLFCSMLYFCPHIFLQYCTVIHAGGRNITVSRERGQINGISILRCGISSKQNIRWIYWVNRTSNEILFYHSWLSQNEDGRRGTFKERKVIGFFNKKFTSHYLKINDSKAHDEGWYRCKIRIGKFGLYTGDIHLTLVVVPETPSRIYGQGTESTNCTEPIVTLWTDLHGKCVSFYCHVGGSKPTPSVDWLYDSQEGVLVFLPNVTNFEKFNVSVTSINRKIDVILPEKILLTCNTWIPDPRTGTLVLKPVCLRVKSGRRGASIHLLIYYLSMTFACGVIASALCFVYRQGKLGRCQRKTKHGDNMRVTISRTTDDIADIDVHVEATSATQLLLAKSQCVKDTIETTEDNWSKEDWLKQMISTRYDNYIMDLSHSNLKYVPKALFALEGANHITELNLSTNQIEEIPVDISGLSSLVTLKVCNCKLKSISGKVILSCPRLWHLDISNNEIESLPSELEKHSRIEMLNISNNKDLENIFGETGKFISKKPTLFPSLKVLEANDCNLLYFPAKLCRSACLETLKLRNNQIKMIPECAGSMNKLRELDLTGNQLKILPFVLGTLQSLSVLNVLENPLEVPETVLTPSNIKTYLREAARSAVVSNSQCMVPILGDTGAGKTSFINCIMVEDPRLVPEPPDTYVVDTRCWKPRDESNSHTNIKFIDFGGLDIYKYIYPMYLRNYSNILLCINGSEYSDANHDTLVTPWMQTIAHTTQHAKVHFILTHIDKIRPDRVQNTKHVLLEKAYEYEHMVQERIKEKLAEIDSQCRDEGDKEKLEQRKRQLNMLKALLNGRPRLPTSVVPVSCTKHFGIDEAKKYLAHVIPKYLIPKKWKQFVGDMQSQVSENTPFFLPESEVVALASKLKIDKDSCSLALECLHMQGYIIWHKDSKRLRDHVFHCPEKLIEKIKTLFSRRLECDGKVENDTSMAVISRHDLLRAPLLLSKEHACILTKLLVKFDLVFPLQLQGAQQGSGKKNEQLMLPSRMPSTKPEIDWNYPKKPNEKEVCLYLNFSNICPYIYFPSLSARINKFINHRQDWQKGVYADDKYRNQVLILLQDETKPDRIEMKVRGEDRNLLWRTALTLQIEMEDLLTKWPGILPKFVVPCPYCLNNKSKEPDLFSDEYIWKGYPRKRLRCQHHQKKFLDPQDVYPPKEVIATMTERSVSLENEPTSKEHKNYLIVSIIVTWYGPELLREILESAIQPHTFWEWLYQYQADLHQVLPMSLYKKLYPPDTPDVHSLPFASLNADEVLSLLKSDKTTLQTPAHGWFSTPADSDDCLGATVLKYDLLRKEKVLRNVKDAFTDKEFSKVWSEAQNIIFNLGGDLNHLEQMLREHLNLDMETIV